HPIPLPRRGGEGVPRCKAEFITRSLAGDDSVLSRNQRAGTPAPPDYFFGSAGLSRRSIFASARSLVTRSDFGFREAYSSISLRTLSKGGGSRMRLSSTFSTCQPNWVLTGPEIWPFSRPNATCENSGTIWSLVK